MRALTTLVVLISSLSQLVGCSLVRAEEAVSLDAPWSNYDRIVVRSANGAIDLASEAGVANVAIRGKKYCGGASLEDARTALRQLTVTAAADPADPRVLQVELRVPSELRGRSAGGSLTVRVPQACPAEVHTSNGAITLTNMNGPIVARTSNGRITLTSIAGNVAADTSNGKVEATGVRGELRAETSNGAVIARGVSGTCVVQTSNGSVTLSDVGGNVTVESSNGPITVDGVSPSAAMLRLMSSNGSVRAEIPAALRGKLDLRTTNGSLNAQLAGMQLASESRSKHTYSAEANGGGDGGLYVQTSNGSITVTSR